MKDLIRRYRYFYGVSAVVTLLCCLLQLLDPPLLRERVESKTFDLRLQLRNLVLPPAAVQDIVIVAVDEKSLAAIGRWPWPRSVTARLVQEISRGKPAAIGIDILFTEPENAASDQELGRAIAAAGNVVLATAFISSGDEARATSAPASVPDLLWDAAFPEVRTVPGIDWRRWAYRPDVVLPPVGAVASGATLGHVATQPDLDGVLRSEIMYAYYGDDCYPSLPLQVARIAAGLPAARVSLHGGTGIQFGESFIPVEPNGRVVVNYLGRENSFTYVSAADLLQNRFQPDQLAGKIVLLGTSALATFDQKVTPFSAASPGVEKNANVVANILRNDFIRKSRGLYELIAILAGSLLLVLFMPRLKATHGILLALFLLGGYLALSCGFLIWDNLWLNALLPLSGMTVVFAAGAVSRLFLEEKRAKEIRAMFSTYVTERLVNEMIRNPDMARLGGEKREISVLFSDVKGFTTYSEKHSPEEVVAILNEYLGEMAEIIMRWEGTLDKFIGDAIVVFWGAPMVQQDHADRAVRCAIEMHARLGELSLKWTAQGKEPLQSGIGINTGTAIVGNIGAEGKKMDYTVIGDEVNLGARVEGLTRRYDLPILVTEKTLERLRPAILQGLFADVSFQGLQRVIVKGKSHPIGIYGVVPASGGAPAIRECATTDAVILGEK